MNEAARLWMESAREATTALARSPLALLVLLLIAPVMAFIAIAIGGGGVGGGFIMGFVRAAAIGWYLALVEIAVNSRRRLSFTDLKDQLGAYMWEVMSVLFIFFVAQLLLWALGVVLGASLAVGILVTALTAAASIAFNPVPEMIWQERTQGMDLLEGAFGFMKENWPEWLLAHVPAIALLAGVNLLLSDGNPSLPEVLAIFETFGPFFGFVSTGMFALPLATGGPVGIVIGLVVIAFVHWFILFRASLYRKLRGSSRRSRAWSARAR